MTMKILLFLQLLFLPSDGNKKHKTFHYFVLIRKIILLSWKQILRELKKYLLSFRKVKNYKNFIMSSDQAIGMMQGAFFVPKGDLLNWVNGLLHLQIKAIEQLGTGAVYCQIVDSMYPGRVPMQRVNWIAKNQWQFISNLKILQQSFSKCKIQKHVDIEKLSKSKYQDNLEFIQWMKRYYDIHNQNDPKSYDAKAARKNIETDFSFIQFRKPAKMREVHKAQEEVKPRINKSKSPYDKVKPRIVNRSVTLQKSEIKIKKSDLYLNKLTQIRNIIAKNPHQLKEGDPISQIKQIVQQIENQLPPLEEEETKSQKKNQQNSKEHISLLKKDIKRKKK